MIMSRLFLFSLPAALLLPPLLLGAGKAAPKSAPFIQLSIMQKYPEQYDKKMLWTDGDVQEVMNYHGEGKDYYRLMVRQYCATELCGLGHNRAYSQVFAYGKLPFKVGDKVLIYGKFFRLKRFGDTDYYYWIDAVSIRKISETRFDQEYKRRNSN